MKLGNKTKFYFILFFLICTFSSAEDKITSTPLINLEKIKPSFEELNDTSESSTTSLNIKEKKKSGSLLKSSHAVNLNETKQFGPLEIKILKCGDVKVNNIIDSVAYMQVKDLTKNENEKVFIFNGWTFASDPSLTPFDHAIYDLQLLNCYKV